MKILVSVKEFYPFSIGGAEVSLFTLLEELAKKHEVIVICVGKRNREIKINTVTILTREILPNIIGLYYVIYFLNLFIWKKKVAKYIRLVKPDLILTQLGFTPAVVSAGKENSIPTITFIRDFIHFCPLSFNKKTIDMCDKICKDCHSYIHHKLLAFFIRRIMVQHKLSLEQSSIVIANSNYLAKVRKSLYGIEAGVIYPFIQLKNYIVEKSNIERDKITFINPEVHKGFKIFLEIAAALPMFQFQVVGELKNSFLKRRFLANELLYKNITFVKVQKDMKHIYATTKILLVPSLWPEPFGRVVIEAMVSGIPAIVSKRGGLPEAVGNAGIIIDDPLNFSEWITNITKLMENDDLYNSLSKKCEERAQLFDLAKTYSVFCTLVKEKLNINL